MEGMPRGRKAGYGSVLCAWTVVWVTTETRTCSCGLKPLAGHQQPLAELIFKKSLEEDWHSVLSGNGQLLAITGFDKSALSQDEHGD